MAEEMKNSENELYEILSHALDLTENKSTYINNVHLSIGANEVVLDMYFLAPDPKLVAPQAQGARAERLQRIVIPLAVAKDLGGLLLKVTSVWEEKFGTIPDPSRPRIE